jgi:tetratricopeptide (TPR) repeat protein
MRFLVVRSVATAQGTTRAHARTDLLAIFRTLMEAQMNRRAAFLALAALTLLATSCKQKTTSTGKVPLTPPADSIHQKAMAAPTPFQLQLDSGNAAYRAKDYKGARDHYTRATKMDSTSAAGWFGVYMAEDKLGNRTAADDAMKKARALNPAFNSGVHTPAPKKEGTT